MVGRRGVLDADDDKAAATQAGRAKIVASATALQPFTFDEGGEDELDSFLHTSRPKSPFRGRSTNLHSQGACA